MEALVVEIAGDLPSRARLANGPFLNDVNDERFPPPFSVVEVVLLVVVVADLMVGCMQRDACIRKGMGVGCGKDWGDTRRDSDHMKPSGAGLGSLGSWKHTAVHPEKSSHLFLCFVSAGGKRPRESDVSGGEQTLTLTWSFVS